MENEELNNRINQAFSSLDGAERAAPAPYLLTRINARLQKETTPGFWSNAFAFFNKPAFAILVLCLLILNLIVVSQKQGTDNNITQNTATTKYDFAINVSSMYDVDNQ